MKVQNEVTKMKNGILIIVLVFGLALVLGVGPVQAGFIECTVYKMIDYVWTPAGSFTTDAINYPAPWNPYGLTTYNAHFFAPVKIAASGGQGFSYLSSGYYLGASIGTLEWPHHWASWSSPGRNPPEMLRFDGFGVAPGVYMFAFSIEASGQDAGAVVIWDPGVTYVPEPATLSLLALGGLVLVCQRIYKRIRPRKT